jgi:hypothetical protein
MSAGTHLCPRGRRGAFARTYSCPCGIARVTADTSVLALNNFIMGATVLQVTDDPAAIVQSFFRPSVRYHPRDNLAKG